MIPTAHLPIYTWLAARTIRDPDAKTSASALYASWLSWCRQRGVGPGHPVGLAAALTAAGFTSYRDSRSRGVIGLRLRPEPATLSQMAHLTGVRESVSA